MNWLITEKRTALIEDTTRPRTDASRDHPHHSPVHPGPGKLNVKGIIGVIPKRTNVSLFHQCPNKNTKYSAGDNYGGEQRWSMVPRNIYKSFCQTRQGDRTYRSGLRKIKGRLITQKIMNETIHRSRSTSRCRQDRLLELTEFVRFHSCALWKVVLHLMKIRCARCWECIRRRISNRSRHIAPIIIFTICPPYHASTPNQQHARTTLLITTNHDPRLYTYRYLRTSVDNDQEERTFPNMFGWRQPANRS